jgi:hypothetical protein
MSNRSAGLENMDDDDDDDDDWTPVGLRRVLERI